MKPILSKPQTDLAEPKIATRMRQVWQLRDSGSGQLALERYLDLCLDLGLDTSLTMDERFSYLLRFFQDRNLIQSLLLVEVAILRGSLELDRSDVILRQFVATCRRFNLSKNSRYFMQAGLNSLCRHHIDRALVLFSRAKRLAQVADDTEMFLKNEFNVILCLEVFGPELKPHLKDFNTRFIAHRNETWAQPICEQLTALELRSALARLDFKELEKLILKPIRGQQSIYQLAFIQELPWLEIDFDSKYLNLLTQFTVTDRMNWALQYRLHTLKGLLIQKDLKATIKLSIKIERIYLWTLQWVCDPKKVSLAKVGSLLEYIGPLDGDEVLTSSAFQMLENSLRWIGLFWGSNSQHIESSLKDINIANHETHLLLDLESQFLDALFVFRDGKADLGKDSLDGLIDFNWTVSAERIVLLKMAKALVKERKEFPHFQGLFQFLSEIVGHGKSELKHGVTLNLLKNRVTVFIHEKIYEDSRNEALNRLLVSLNSSNIQSKEYLMEYCFGINDYDCFVHDPKIANLISKANTMIRPFGEIKTLRGMVYFEAQEDHWQIIGSTHHTTDARLVFAKGLFWQHQNAMGPNTASEPDSQISSQWLTRFEIQEQLMVSKATATRKINQWLSAGILHKKGKGKFTRYKKQAMEMTL